MGNTNKLPKIEMSDSVIAAINQELAYQATLEGLARADAVDHGVAGQLVTLKHYIDIAFEDWTKTAGDTQCLNTLRKVAATAIRALEQYGCPFREGRTIILKIGKHGAPVKFNFISETEESITVSDEDHNIWIYDKNMVKVVLL